MTIRFEKYVNFVSVSMMYDDRFFMLLTRPYFKQIIRIVLQGDTKCLKIKHTMHSLSQNVTDRLSSVYFCLCTYNHKNAKLLLHSLHYILTYVHLAAHNRLKLLLILDCSPSTNTINTNDQPELCFGTFKIQPIRFLLHSLHSDVDLIINLFKIQSEP